MTCVSAEYSTAAESEAKWAPPVCSLRFELFGQKQTKFSLKTLFLMIWSEAYHRDSETERPSLQRKTSSSLQLQTACWDRCKTKMLLITFFSENSIMHHEFILQAWSINHHSYTEPLRHLCDAVCYKQPRKWHSGGWKTYCDNALAYSSQLVQHFWIKTVHAEDLWTPIVPRHGFMWHSPLSPN